MRAAALLPLVVAGVAVAGEVHDHTFENGLRLLVVEDHAEPVLTFSIWYRVGSRDEASGATGSAHLLEHMLFKSSKRFGPGEMTAALDRIGADWNATTSYDYTNYYETVPSAQFDFVASLEADRMIGARISDGDLEKERVVVKNELAQDENTPEGMLSDQLWATAFLAHPYHHPVIGWPSDIDRTSAADLRGFYRRWYEPGDATIAIVGDVTDAQAVATVRKHFGPIGGARTAPRVVTEEPAQLGERRLVVRKAGEMPLVSLAWKVPASTDADTIPLKVAQLVLSGTLDLGPLGDALDAGISNRLYQALVDKELCTQVSIEYAPLHDPGLLTILATPRNDVALEKVEAAVRGEVKGLRDTLVSDDELSRAKARAQAAYGLLEDGTAGRAMLLGYFGSVADWRLADQFPERVRAVTAADVQRVARRVFTDDGLTVGYFVPTRIKPSIAQPRGKGGPTTVESIRGAHYREADGVGAGSASGSIRPAITVQAIGHPPHARSVTRVVMPNGLILLVRENHGNPTFALSGFVDAGAAANPPDQPKLAALTASALMRGTETQSRLQIAHALEGLGASLEIHSGPEYAEINGKGLARDLGTVLDVLADVLRHPAFADGEVEKLVRETVADLDQAEDDTQVRAHRALMQALFPRGHPLYAYNHEDEVASVRATNAKALRAFHRARYGPDGTAIVIVGDVKTEAVVDLATRLFGDWRRTGASPSRIPDVPLRAASGRAVVYVEDKASADVVLGHAGAVGRLDPDYYAADLACYALGGAPSSLLFRDVRDERGLTYGIDADLAAGRSRGPFVIGFTANPDNVDLAVKATLDDVRAFVERGPTEAEVRAAKDTMIGRYRVALATNTGVAMTLAELEGQGLGPEYVERQVDQYEAVTRNQVAAAARKYFHPDRLFTAIAGSYPPKKP